MKNKRKPSTEDGIPVVTYSRLPADREPPEAGAHALRDADPWLDGVEVPLVERQGRPRVAPDIRADARTEAYDDPPVAAPAAVDLFEPKRRRPRRLLTTVAAIVLGALVAGFGILALTFHAATTVTVEAPAKDPQADIADLQKQIDQLANSSGPASVATRAKIAELEARLADLEAAKAPAASATPALRTIPTDAAATADAAPAADLAPPAPRERPAKKEARAVPDGAEKPEPAKVVVPVTAVSETPAARSEPKLAAVPAGRGKTGDAAPAGDADFIARVEKALADAPPDPKRAASAVPPRAPVLAPAATLAPAGQLAPADEEPAGIAPAAGAPAADALPSDIGPAIRVIPPAGGASADARPILRAPRTVDPTAIPALPAPATLAILPEPGTPVPPEPIPNGQ